MRREWPWMVALLIVVALPHLNVLVGRDAYRHGDMGQWFLPVRVFTTSQMRAGNLTPWCWLVGCGYPFWAEPQTGTFYLPNLLFLTGGRPELLFGWLLWLHYALAALGVWTLSRRLGGSRVGALLAGVVFAGSGFMTAHLGAYALVCAAAWLPWWWWSLVRWRAHPDWVGPAVIVPCSAAQLLCGHPHMWFISLTASVCFQLVYRPEPVPDAIARQPTRRRLALAGVPLAAALLGVGVASVQIMPTAVLAQQSIRRVGSYGLITDYSLKPRDLVALVDRERADRVGVEYTGYLGAGVLLLALVGAVRGRVEPADRALWVLAVVALLMALGKFNPIYHLLAQVPVVSSLRCPSRWLLVWCLSLSVLAGLSLTRLQTAQMGPRGHPARTALLLLLAAHYLRWHLLMIPGAIVVWWEGLGDRLPPHVYEYFAQSAYFAHGSIREPRTYPPVLASLLVLSLLGSAARNRRPGRWVLATMVAICLLEALWSGRAYNIMAPPTALPSNAAALASLPPEGRVLTGIGLGPTLTNKTILDGVAVPDFYGPLVLSRHLEAMDLARRQDDAVAAALFGVAWRVAPVEALRTLAGWQPVRQVAGFYVDANEHYRGLAWPVFQVRAEEHMRALLPAAGQQRRELLQAAFLKHPEAISLTAPEDASGQATLLRQDGRGYAFDCQMSHDGLLLITSCWYPGVHAAVDGRPAPVLEANIAFCAVPVPAGRHQVELGYAPVGLRAGLTITLLTLAVVAALACTLLLRARSEAHDGDDAARLH